MSKKKPIEKSPKYGLNPVKGVCFYCGKETGDVRCLGRIRVKGPAGTLIADSDLKAPEHAVFSYEPCKDCEKRVNSALRIYKVEPSESRVPEISPGKYATGCALMSMNDARQFLDNCFSIQESVKERILEQRGLELDAEAFDKLFGKDGIVKMKPQG